MDDTSHALSKIHTDWHRYLDFELIEKILSNLEGNFAPEESEIFNAFKLSPKDIKVAIIGQDPYPTLGDATGLAFSVNRNQNLPRSLKNIFKELQNDLGGALRTNGDLSDWSEQGVFLLNRILTVPIGSALGHRELGWQEITSQAIKTVGENGAIALLMGREAQECEPLFERVICTAHPSPLSAHRGFFGSKPFSKINSMLHREGSQEILWA